MNPAVAQWGIELVFIRTKVGEEFDVAESLISGSSAAGATFFTTYGHFDLVGIRTISSLNTPYAVVLHRNVYESAPFRFFAYPESIEADFRSTIAGAPAAVAIMAKIHPLVIKSKAGETRWHIAARVQEKLPSAFIFFGLGFSEMLIIDTGFEFSQFLTTVRELRSLTGKPDCDCPALSKTSTFPFVSYGVVHKQKRYDLLQGDVDPVMTISCQPAAERVIAKAIGGGEIVPKHIWGKNDLLLAWSRSLKLSELSQFVTEFRTNVELSDALLRTTTYLETPVHENPIEEHADVPARYEFMNSEEEQNLFKQLAQVTPHSLRASLSNLALRLSACIRSPLLTEYYRDMANTFPYLNDLLLKLNGADMNLARHARVQATRIADTARSAINQRYAALELHPETLAHSQSPFLCDIRSIVCAATCVPQYIFGRLFGDRRADQVWSGFILFAGGYSPQWLDHDVLALPASSLFTPVEEWWKVTHETAHAVFRLANIEQNLPTNYRAWFTSQLNDFDLLHIAEEMFANWFDWKYVFRGNTTLYLHTIWASWLKLPGVWRRKAQYFARSFAIFLAEDSEAIAAVAKENKDDAVIPFIRKRWAAYQELIRDIPEMREFMSQVTEASLKATFELVYDFYPVIRWYETQFEERCGVGGLSSRLAPDYPNLHEHVKKLMDGIVILETVVDPPRLHVALLQALKGRGPSLATEIAYIYTFENAYIAGRQPAK